MEIIEIYKLWLWFLAVCENSKPRMKMVSVVNGQLVDKTASGNIQKLCISVVGRILWGFVHSMYSYRPNSQYVQWTCKGTSLFSYLLSLSISPIPHSLSVSLSPLSLTPSLSPSFFPSIFASYSLIPWAISILYTIHHDITYFSTIVHLHTLSRIIRPG